MSGNNAWLTNNYPTPDNAQSPPTNNSVSTSQPTSSPKNVSNSQQSQPRIITRDSSFLSDLPSGTYFSEEPILGSVTSVPPFSQDLNDTFPNTPPEVAHDQSVQKERVYPYNRGYQGEDETNLSHSQSSGGNQTILNADVDQLGVSTNDLGSDWKSLPQYNNEYFLPVPSDMGYLYDVGQNVNVPFISNDLNRESQKKVIKSNISNKDVINIKDTGLSREHVTIPVSKSQVDSENITIDAGSQLSEKVIVRSDIEHSDYDDEFTEFCEDLSWISMNRVGDVLRRQSDYFENMSNMFSTMEFAKVEPESDDNVTNPTHNVSETRRSMRPRNKTSYNYPRYSYPSGRRSKKRRRKHPLRSRSHSATENEADVDDMSNSGHGHQVESDEHTHELSPVPSDREEIPEDVSSITEDVNNSINYSREHDLRSRKVVSNYKVAGIATRRAKRIKTSQKMPIQKNSNNLKTIPKHKNIRRKSTKPIKVEKPVKPVKSTKLKKNTKPTYSRKRKDDSEWVMDEDDFNESDSETQDSSIVSAPAKRQRPPPKPRISSNITPRGRRLSATSKPKTRTPKKIAKPVEADVNEVTRNKKITKPVESDVKVTRIKKIAKPVEAEADINKVTRTKKITKPVEADVNKVNKKVTRTKKIAKPVEAEVNKVNKVTRTKKIAKPIEAEADVNEPVEAEADVNEADVNEADVNEADVYEADVNEADVYEADVNEADVYEADVNEVTEIKDIAKPVEPETEEVTVEEKDAEIEIDPVECEPIVLRPKRTKNDTNLDEEEDSEIEVDPVQREPIVLRPKRTTKNVTNLVDTPTKKVTPKKGRKPKTTSGRNKKRESKRSRASSIASGHAIFDKPPILDPDLVAVSADDPNVLANAVRVLTAGSTYDIVDTPGSTPVSLTDNSRLSTPSPVFIKPGNPKSRSASFTNAERPVLETGSSSTQTSIVWTRDHWIQLKGLYEDTKNEYIQNGKTGKGNEDVYKEVIANFIMINSDNESFGEDNIRKRIIALEAAELERNFSRRSSVDSANSTGSRPSISHYNSAYSNMRDIPVTKRKRSGSNLTNLETEDEIEQSPSVRRRRISSSSLTEDNAQVTQVPPVTPNNNGTLSRLLSRLFGRR
ncbi:18374_t:CDS:2 [Gigaspora margarita]|uniref:18374_t:CDS:1 n=1 Tax=Gigaspora margarita TaxID=4874 RepID=A0ABN7ULI0_GIGMA|nr:18374_t:CDS:2 [Gigaspora margarita]